MKKNWLRIMILGLGAMAFLFSASLAVAEDPPAVPGSNGHAFVGSKGCKTCHMGEKNGKIWETWLESAHSKTLSKLDAAKGEDKDPKCLKCHTTGFGTETGFKVDAVDKTPELLAAVGCESCHGGGADYKSMKVMKDHDASVAAGLLIPNEATCKACHNEESPTFKGFNYAEALAKIAHKIPDAAPAAGE